MSNITKYFKVPDKHSCGCDDFDIEDLSEKKLKRRKFIEAYCIGNGGCGCDNSL